MAITPDVILPPKQLENALTTQYTAAGIKAITLTKCTVTNTSASNVTFNMYIVPTSGTATSSNQIIKDKIIAVGETYTCPEVINHQLKNGYFISTNSSAAASLTMMISANILT